MDILSKADFPFIGGSYEARSKTFDDARTVNMYPEIQSYGAGKNLEVSGLFSRSGLRPVNSIGLGPIRGQYTLSNTQLSFIASGNEIYQLSAAAGIPVLVNGNLTTSTGQVNMIDNGETLLIVDGTNGYNIDLSDTVPTANNPIYEGVGNGIISTITVAPTATAQTWILTATTATNFTVVGSVTGAAADLTVDSPYTNTDLSFEIASGSTPFLAGDNYIFTVFAANTLVTIDDPHFYNGAKTCTYQGGYFICEMAGTTNFFFSNPDDSTWPPNNIESVDSSPDILVGVISNNQQLYLQGSRTQEVWAPNVAGQASAPFLPITGRAINIGCIAPYTIQKIAGTFLWLGANDQGGGIVYSQENDTPTRVSTHAIEYQLQQLGDLSNSTAITWQEFGHQFYAINAPGANTTLVYDLTTKQWCENQSRQNGFINRWFAQCHCFLNGVHVMGDYRNGNLYALDSTYFMDNDQPLPRTRQTPHSSKGVAMCFYGELVIDIQPGAGTLTINPRYALEISRDGGFTWGNAIYATAGLTGQYTARVRWQRLGRGRDIVFRVTCDDPVNVVMLGAYLYQEVGTS